MQASDVFKQQLLGSIPRLRRYARTLVFDAQAADDLVQTVLERALTHWHQFDPERDILVWVLSIAHNAHLDWRRREARMTVVDPAQASDEQDAVAADMGPDVGLRIDLLRALAQLPVEQREPLLLVSVEQLSYAECAQVLHIPIGTVMSRVSRGRAALREWMNGDGPSAAKRTTLKRVV